jgi:hypothetical protein
MKDEKRMAAKPPIHPSAFILGLSPVHLLKRRFTGH